MPTYKIGIGSKVSIGKLAANGNTATFTLLAGVQDITLPEATADEIEVTSMDSPNRTKEYIAGLIDNGELSLDMNWEPKSATDTLLSGVRKSGELVHIKFEIVGADPETYVGFCKGYTRNAPVADKLTATATFRISGQLGA